MTQRVKSRLTRFSNLSSDEKINEIKALLSGEYDRVTDRLALEQRRREHWPYGLPATDLDHVILEYDNMVPCALIEYKYSDMPTYFLLAGQTEKLCARASLVALRDLADRARLPLFVVAYNGDFTKFLIIPLGYDADVCARSYDLITTSAVSERYYVDFLMWVRRRKRG